MSSTLLRHATIVHGAVTEPGEVPEPVDLLIENGRISAVAPTITEPADTVIDLAGHLLLPAAVEPHAHLDKAYLAERAVNVSGDLAGAVDAMIVLGGVDPADIVQRAERAARLMAANGYTAVRSHADTMTSTGLQNVIALTEVRRRVVDVIDVEIVALTGSPVVGPRGSGHRTLLREAIDAGADLVGGCPHLEPEGRIEAATDVLLEIAADAGVGVDLHTDETHDPAVLGLEHLADRVLQGFAGRVTASHCVSLGQQTDSEQRRIAELVAAAGIGVITLPATNLWLGGRASRPVLRGLTAIDVLRAAGVAVAAGADNLQDPFNPLGRACPFETAALMVLAAHDLPTAAWGAVSGDACRVLGRRGGSIEPGQVADLLAVPGNGVRQVIAEAPSPRRVFRAGVENVPR